MGGFTERLRLFDTSVVWRMRKKRHVHPMEKANAPTGISWGCCTMTRRVNTFIRTRPMSAIRVHRSDSTISL